MIGVVGSNRVARADGRDEEVVDEALFIVAGNHGGRRRDLFDGEERGRKIGV